MKNNNDPQHELARAVALTLIGRGWRIALAESCTGGLVCATLTDLAGSSNWLERGYITYSNAAKSECLDVPAETIESFGAVSEPVAKAMAEGALCNANVNAAISITGIAGPTGGSVEKLVGTVCFGWAIKENVGRDVVNTITLTKHFNGDRQVVREQARDFALSHFLELLKPKNA
ncbi:CinA family protein [Polynucleobacter sp. AP-Sving-400A-A2]|uniref:CinA family protein n=1 Tax=Polynucleobacter sp. AP-Sving-400A-A2 TaxID=2081049 RepID=UPI001BFEA3CE|nr:CinA family protein [Polynucleobacter sp. AP-Sving-400A-A2]QWE14782.1 CinA family protein [Polynucleobacter sp. AP-Sving-400A-A2]